MIEFKNVEKVYPNGTVALKGVNLKIEDGEFVFIVGASGAGKTTMAKLLLHEERATAGRIMVDDFNLTKMSDRNVPYYRRTLGVVFQDFRLFPNMTVYDNIAFAMRVIGESPKKIRRIIPYILKLVNLSGKAKSYPRELSGGEQQRVALARALVNNPRVIIADEPTGNIDPKMSLEIMELLVRINKLKKTVIVVTHAKALVDYFRKRVITIDDGEVVSDRVTGGYIPPLDELERDRANYDEHNAQMSMDNIPLARRITGQFKKVQRRTDEPQKKPAHSARPAQRPQQPPAKRPQPTMPPKPPQADDTSDKLIPPKKKK